MKQFGVVLCVLVAVALLAYNGARQPSVSTPPPGLQTSVVPQPSVTADRGLGQIASQRDQLGGADTMANLWPECSTGYQGWQGPGFRDKDGFENYLWYHVCVNRDLSLDEAQRRIATNWRKYWEVAGKPRCRNRADCK
jgi:hypothetical protein